MPAVVEQARSNVPQPSLEAVSPVAVRPVAVRQDLAVSFLPLPRRSRGALPFCARPVPPRRRHGLVRWAARRPFPVSGPDRPASARGARPPGTKALRRRRFFFGRGTARTSGRDQVHGGRFVAGGPRGSCPIRCIGFPQQGQVLTHAGLFGGRAPALQSSRARMRSHFFLDAGLIQPK